MRVCNSINLVWGRVVSRNPINYTVHFILELVGLYAFGLWGWQASDNGIIRLILAIGLPLVAGVAWGVFGTPGDKRGRPEIKIPVEIPGWLRLALEVGYFALATLAFYAVGDTTVALVFGLVALVQTLLAYDRIGWLLTH